MIYCCGHHQFFSFKNLQKTIDFGNFYKKNQKIKKNYERIDNFYGRIDGFVNSLFDLSKKFEIHCCVS
jgi:hypothetical protein